jgi:hypothetical protein
MKDEGCAMGLLVTGFLWVIIFTIAAIIVAIIAKAT